MSAERGRVVYFFCPGDPDARTGGYLYNARICRRLTELGWQVRRPPLAGDFPRPSPSSLRDARRRLAALPDDALTVIDGLALAAMAEPVAAASGRLRLIALIHHPLARETDLSREQRRTFRRQERAALAAVRQVIVTSAHTARALTEDYAVPAARITVVPPGVSAPHGLWPRRGPVRRAAPTRLLCVATLTPRKGHPLLLRALAGLRRERWRLSCIGSTGRDPHHALRTRALCRRLGLRRRVEFCGERSPVALDAAYRRADLLVSASYYEGYGMALAEALSYGLPVVASSGGAAADTVPEDAGLHCPPGDVGALRARLRRVIVRPATRRRLAAAARRAGRALPDWAQSGDRFAAALERQRAARRDC